MQVEYDGVHSVLIGDFVNGAYDPNQGFVDTWKDLHLIPASRPIIAPPKVRENYVDIPGAHGNVDITDILIGRPLYENREGSLEFYVDHTNEDYNRWDVAYDYLLNLLHGFKRKIILKDSPSYFYEGRISLNEWKTDQMASTITLDYNVQPFKYMLWNSTDDWLWDPFDFLNGTIKPDASWFTHEAPYDTTGTEYWTTPVVLEQAYMGTLPVIPTITAELKDKSVQDGALGSTSYIQVRVEEYNPATSQWVNGRVIKLDSRYINGSMLTAKTPDLAITNCVAGYKYKFSFDNHLKNAEGVGATAICKFTFRPGRL